MRIHTVAMTLTRGGSERVLLEICKALRQSGHEVTVYTRGTARGSEYPVPPGIPRRTFPNASRKPFLRGIPAPGFARRCLAIRKQLLTDQPDVILAFGVQVAVRTLLFTLGAGTPIVVSERNNPESKVVALPIRILRRLLYPKAAALVLVSADMAPFFSWMPAHKVHVIPNAAANGCGQLQQQQESNPTLQRANTRTITVVAMGRLVPQKGFDLLLLAFAKVRNRFREVRLVILGGGPEANRLQALARELGIQGAVEFPGVLNEPNAMLHKADLFVLSSRFEGFPNSVLEALACELPVVAFDCPTGPREIIADGENGFLVPAQNIDMLAEAILKLCRDPDLRARLSQAARPSISHLAPDAILAQWEQLLHAVSENPTPAAR